MSLYEQVLRDIKEAYFYHLVNFVAFDKDSLVRRKIKRENYCQRHNLNPEDLEIIDEVVKQRIEEQCRLAQIYALLRDDNCTISELKEARRIEEKLGNAENVLNLNQELAKAEAHYAEVNKGRVTKISCRNRAKSTLTYSIMSNLKFNVAPTSRKNWRSKEQFTWTKKIDLLKRKLAQKDIYLDKRLEVSPKHEKVFLETWREINQNIEKGRDAQQGIKPREFTLNMGEIYSDLANRYPDSRFRSQSILRPLKQEQFFKVLNDYSRGGSRFRTRDEQYRSSDEELGR